MAAEAPEALLLEIVGQEFLEDAGEVVGVLAHAVDELGVQREVHGALAGVEVEGGLHDAHGMRIPDCLSSLRPMLGALTIDNPFRRFASL